MAKRKLRAWTKKDIAELKAHSKSRTPVAKISKVMKRTVGQPIHYSSERAALLVSMPIKFIIESFHSQNMGRF